MPPVQLCPQESGTWASTCTVSTISQSTQDSAPPVTTDLLPAPVLSLPGFNPETVKSHSTSIVPPRTSSVPLPGSNGGVSVPGSTPTPSPSLGSLITENPEITPPATLAAPLPSSFPADAITSISGISYFITTITGPAGVQILTLPFPNSSGTSISSEPSASQTSSSQNIPPPNVPNQPELLKILLPILLAIIIALLGLLFFIHRKRKRQQKNLNKTITELGSGGERKELDGSSNGSGMGRKGRVELMGDRGHTGELDGYNWKRELDGHEVAELAEKNSIMVGVRESKVQELGSGGSIREAMEEPGGGRRRSL